MPSGTYISNALPKTAISGFFMGVWYRAFIRIASVKVAIIRIVPQKATKKYIIPKSMSGPTADALSDVNKPENKLTTIMIASTKEIIPSV